MKNGFITDAKKKNKSNIYTYELSGNQLFFDDEAKIC